MLTPTKLREKLLAELHSDHPGISRMKAVARGYFWWPGLDDEIQQLVKACQTCTAVKHTPTTTLMHPWEWPPRPWQRIHLDFSVSFQGTNFLIAVDAHPKWPEVEIMKNTTAVRTIEVLQGIFARNGLLKQVVTDNGPQFVSEEFSTFMRENGAPCHPASNGLAERFVQLLSRPHCPQENPCPLVWPISCCHIGVLPMPLLEQHPVHYFSTDLSGHVWTFCFLINMAKLSEANLSKKTHMTRKRGFVNSLLAKRCWQETYVLERIGYLPL